MPTIAWRPTPAQIYGLVSNIEVQAAVRLVSKIKESAIQDGFTARDVYRKHWGLLDDTELVGLALDELELLGWLRMGPPVALSAPFGRPPPPVFRINPKIKNVVVDDRVSRPHARRLSGGRRRLRLRAEAKITLRNMKAAYEKR